MFQPLFPYFCLARLPYLSCISFFAFCIKSILGIPKCFAQFITCNSLLLAVLVNGRNRQWVGGIYFKKLKRNNGIQFKIRKNPIYLKLRCLWLSNRRSSDFLTWHRSYQQWCYNRWRHYFLKKVSLCRVSIYMYSTTILSIKENKTEVIGLFLLRKTSGAIILSTLFLRSWFESAISEKDYN